MSIRMNEWRKANPDQAYGHWLKQAYGITLDEYNQMLTAQNGVCAICQQPERRTRNGRIRRLGVDHCHDTLRVRGLLCADCNDGIEKFKDTVSLLESAISYLTIQSQMYVKG